MHRLINRLTRSAFYEGQELRQGNTRVFHTDTHARVELHDSEIVRTAKGSGVVEFTLAGWDTAVTRSRINALLPAGVYVHRLKGQTVLTSFGDSQRINDEGWYAVQPDGTLA